MKHTNLLLRQLILLVTAISAVASLHAQIILTTPTETTAGREASGIMFDLEVTNPMGIRMTGVNLDVGVFSGTTIDVAFYTRTGTMANDDFIGEGGTTLSDWTYQATFLDLPSTARTVLSDTQSVDVTLPQGRHSLFFLTQHPNYVQGTTTADTSHMIRYSRVGYTNVLYSPMPNASDDNITMYFGTATSNFVVADGTEGSFVGTYVGSGGNPDTPVTLNPFGSFGRIGNAGPGLSLSYQVVPEPATYALLLGFGALGLVFWHRRRLDK